MPSKPDRPKELEALGKKVREASEVIGHLRDSNRALANELEELKLRLADGAPAGLAGKAEASAELSLLRQERKQIRDRIVHLLEQLEQISSSPSTD
ncbi:MAG TPA: hypothetical protein VGC53_11200 [Vicinamibacteria bacterium]|jgi:uncharacterized coiled-coil DUF342 family protein